MPYAARHTARRAAQRRKAKRLSAARPTADRRRGAGPGRAARRRALRREAPVVLGLLLDEHDFAAMTDYPSFPHDDYGQYLDLVEGLLRDLRGRGAHVAVTLFDPQGYADYCDAGGRPSDSSGTRVRYVAETTTAGPAVPYTGQPLEALRGDLAREADRRAAWERATDLLMAAGACAECGQDLAQCAFDRASDTLLRLLDAVGEGTHHIVCSLPAGGSGPPLLAALHIEAAPSPHASGDPALRFSEADALVLCTVIAASEVRALRGGLVVRSTTGAGPTRAETVRGWSLRVGEPYPLSAAEVFNAYCTDPATGDPVPPEPGVDHAPGLPLPPRPGTHP